MLLLCELAPACCDPLRQKVMPMPNVYNIFNIRINNVSNGGAVNFGDNLFSNNAANQKAVGGNTIMGDASPSVNVDNNLVNDPDEEDMPTNSTQIL
jgi:hypothetical protein